MLQSAAQTALQSLENNTDGLTPTQKLDRAKLAERAHLLATCMELGVEIHDVRSLSPPIPRISQRSLFMRTSRSRPMVTACTRPSPISFSS